MFSRQWFACAWETLWKSLIQPATLKCADDKHLFYCELSVGTLWSRSLLTFGRERDCFFYYRKCVCFSYLCVFMDEYCFVNLLRSLFFFFFAIHTVERVPCFVIEFCLCSKVALCIFIIDCSWHLNCLFWNVKLTWWCSPGVNLVINDKSVVWVTYTDHFCFDDDKTKSGWDQYGFIVIKARSILYLWGWHWD